MYKKLYNKVLPKKSKIEIDAVNWYNSLSKNEQEYVKWIKNFYEER